MEYAASLLEAEPSRFLEQVRQVTEHSMQRRDGVPILVQLPVHADGEDWAFVRQHHVRDDEIQRRDLRNGRKQ